ncbi:flavin monoamine oxidase family protein [Nonlabens antarcticus]|uniref:flavin monoamine oxidase family protein n=1 Tax=Nonlabens antarcticus TaxID=392714 RepID=UPI0018916839|nr:FAD-dependent oxidoreductase [Nonlabens antarcticus]
MHSKITILGAGLTGLTLAYLLQQQGFDFQILEAKKCVGGRLNTKLSGNHIPIDLGAAWLWDYNPNLKQLLNQLNLTIYPQEMGDKVWYQPHASADFQIMQMPPQQQVSYRINGGSTNLALSIAATLDKKQIHLNTVVESIEYVNHTYTIKTDQGIFTSDYVVSCIPPAVVANSISFDPQLPVDYLNVARETQTWMEDSIKFGIGFKSAFWEEKGLPATTFSNAGPIAEMYDYSNLAKDRFALMGFLHPHMNDINPEDREARVIKQLESIFGEDVLDYVTYEDYAWNQDIYVNSIPENRLVPHQNNGNLILRKSLNNNTLIMAGSETSAVLPGYMEGAVNSALKAFEMLKNCI